MDTPLQLRARKYADKVSNNFPGNHAAWGIAYDTYLTASKELISAGDVKINDENWVLIKSYVAKRYSLLGIAKAIGLPVARIKSTVDLIRQEMI